MDSESKQILIRVTADQIKKLEDARARLRPIPSVSELIRRAIDAFLKNK